MGETHLYHSKLALGQIGQLDLLDGNSLAGAPVEGLIDRAKGAFAEAFSKSLRFLTSARPRSPRTQSPTRTSSLLLYYGHEIAMLVLGGAACSGQDGGETHVIFQARILQGGALALLLLAGGRARDGSALARDDDGGGPAIGLVLAVGRVHHV